MDVKEQMEILRRLMPGVVLTRSKAPHGWPLRGQCGCLTVETTADSAWVRIDPWSYARTVEWQQGLLPDGCEAALRKLLDDLQIVAADVLRLTGAEVSNG